MILLLMIYILVINVINADVQNINYDEIRNLLLIAENTNINGCGNIEVNYEKIYLNKRNIDDEEKYKYDVYYVFKGNKSRFEEKIIMEKPKIYGGGKIERIVKRAYNGEKSNWMMLYRDYPNGTFKISGSINKNNGQLFNEYNFNTTIVTDNTSELFKKFKIINKTSTSIDSKQILIITFQSANRDTTIEAYLCKEYLYQPIKIIVKEKENIYTVLKEYKVSKVVYPNQISINKINKVSSQMLNYNLKYSNKYKFNIHIADDNFELVYPNGLEVEDTRNNKKILIKNKNVNNIKKENIIIK